MNEEGARGGGEPSEAPAPTEGGPQPSQEELRERIEEYPASEALERLQAWTGEVFDLPEHNGAQRQRRMIDAGATPAEVYAASVRETHATYLQEEPVP